MRRSFIARPFGVLALTASLAACGAGDHNRWYPNPGADGPPSPACVHAREQKGRVPGLLAEGKLGRALRLMQRFEGACQAEAEATWAAHVTTLAAAGRTAEAQSFAARIDRSDRATAEDRRAAASAVKDAEARDHAPDPGGDVAPPRAPFRFTPDDDIRYEAAWTTKDRAVGLFLAGAEARAKGDAAAAKQRFVDAWTTSHPNPRALYEAGLAAEAMGDKAEAQRLWDRASFDGAEAARPEIASGALVGAFDTRMAWSPSGRLLAVSSEGQIAVYDTSLRLYRRVDAREAVHSLAFSPDDSELFAGLESGHIRRVHLVLDTVRHDLDAHSGPVSLLSLSPDGQRIASAGSDGSLRIWGGRDSGLKVVPIALGKVIDLAWSHDGALIAWAEEGRIGVVDTRSFTSLGVVEPRGAVIRAVSFSADAKAISAVTATEEIRVDVAHLKASPRAMEKTPSELAAARSNVIASATGTAVTIRDAGSRAVLGSIPIQPPESLLRMAISPDGKTLAAAFLGHAIRLYTVAPKADARPTASLAPTSPLESLAISPDGKALAAGAEDGGVDLWRIDHAGLRVLDRAADAGAHARAISFSPDGKLLASGFDTGAVSVWDAASARPLASFRAEAAVLSLSFSPDSARLAVGADAPTIHLINPSTGAPLGELRLNAGAVRALAFSLDGRSLLSASQEGVTLWDPPARKGARYVAYGKEPHDLAWSPDGSSFAVAASDATLAVGSPAGASPAQVVPVPPHVLALAFSAQGFLATAENDRSVGYRNTKGKLVQRFPVPEAPPRDVAFTRDGSIVAAFADGAIRVFRPPVARAVAVLRAAAKSSPGKEAGVAMTPAGHLDFLGDVEVMRAETACRIGATIYPFAVCAEQFQVPGLLAMALAGQDPAEADP